ncbi:hypothetical protein K402DRAFT_379331 [Aulographum hederae CBS 113979]|uniref:RING-type E3 ubiquitin transferase n=1 Tax=Aulographum hederae CBS 113979 TaxID=1176131 RepID=A0A6G1GXF1_9PEZI|nr:hypothetical protein K402DRAFT_379331 [Aulographum hederae CBS 113979]
MSTADDPLHAGRSADAPDIMNDPAYATNTRHASKAAEEPDTCRICRSEGTKEEALFYPCKCSGSIKFVHQECLMEWLQHSQKKYCELCKTPFRFTKLYHPQMPRSLPTTVFLRRAILHMFRQFVTYCRGMAVFVLWLFGLPWMMRFVWWSLFWLGDLGWLRDAQIIGAAHALDSGITATSDPTEPSAATSLSNSTASAALLPPILAPFSQTLNLSAGEPLALSFVRKYLANVFSSSDSTKPSRANSSSFNITVEALRANKQSSVLSELGLFESLRTASPTLHRAFLDIIEGQIITLSVVVAFILIFLIREWVVQQQPLLNMAALNQHAHDAANQADQHVEVGPVQLPEDPDSEWSDSEEEDNDPDEREENDEDREERSQAREIIKKLPPEIRRAIKRNNLTEVVDIINGLPAEEAANAKKILRERSHVLNGPLADSGAVSSGAGPAGPTDRNHEIQLDQSVAYSEAESSSPSRRPAMPDRGRSFAATEIRRSLEENASVPSGDAVEADREETDKESESDNSSESWQQVDRSESKGKEKSRGDGPPIEWSFDDSTDSGKTDESDRLNPSLASHAAAKGSDEGDQDRESTRLQSDANEKREPPDDTFSATEPSNNPFHPDYDGDAFDGSSGAATPLRVDPVDGLPENAPQDAPVRQEGLAERLFDWFWGDVAPVNGGGADFGENDEHVVQNLADELPFVPFAQALPIDADEADEAPGGQVQDPEVVAAAVQAGVDLDPDAADDAEDLEGILELIGMQGPIMGLVQNLLFCGFLIAATVTCAVWLPYLWGKLVLLLMGNPITMMLKVPLRLISGLADLVVDGFLFSFGWVAYLVSVAVRMVFHGPPLPVWVSQTGNQTHAIDSIALPAKALAENASIRLGKTLASSAFNESDILLFSLYSHASLRMIQATLSDTMAQAGNMMVFFWQGLTGLTPRTFGTAITKTIPEVLAGANSSVSNWVRLVFSPPTSSNFPMMTLDLSSNMAPADPELAYWSASDRTITVFTGYAFFALMGAFYLQRGKPFTRSEKGKRIERALLDLLSQAGGVVKVIIVISIEMLAFPLFCGLLLDFALLPLFESGTFASRLAFMMDRPWTSGFVHWFIGTCYMFHFALFVSMCRKIMRTGVLYFIRDPDDPSFHPVRDVLERSISTQLRKIAFSAIVYGALIMLCLGGVVWGLFYAFDSVLPIHWTSSESPLEFPLDILFYNFFTPFIVKYTRPTDGLHAMYKWWFRSCARFLRLSDFLFGDNRKDEEGHHVRRSWASWLKRSTGNVEEPVIGETRKQLADDRETEVYFLRDGKYVLAPASDQVRISKGTPVFINIEDAEIHVRLHGTQAGEGTQSNNTTMIIATPKDKFTKVYIPPWFRIRIGLFIFTIWLFAAATGVGVTILPLIFGRHICTLFFAPASRVNDIYAFSLGIYSLGGTLYAGVHLPQLAAYLRSTIHPTAGTTAAHILNLVQSRLAQLARILYVYSALGIVLPILFATVLEFYVLIPLHTYLGPTGHQHVIHLIQDWTLGILYVRIALRVVMWNRDSRFARAAQAVVADGYLNPNARLATRCFVLPVALLFGIVLLTPGLVAAVANMTVFREEGEEGKVRVWRYTYPVMMVAGMHLWVIVLLQRATERWRSRIRDEVYLIGERLHNFGERKPPGQTARP